MQLHPFSSSGVFGDPRTATAEKGRAILDATIDESVRVVRAFIS
jgi:creatinine amidohydrolase